MAMMDGEKASSSCTSHETFDKLSQTAVHDGDGKNDVVYGTLRQFIKHHRKRPTIVGENGPILSANGKQSDVSAMNQNSRKPCAGRGFQNEVDVSLPSGIFSAVLQVRVYFIMFMPLCIDLI